MIAGTYGEMSRIFSHCQDTLTSMDIFADAEIQIDGNAKMKLPGEIMDTSKRKRSLGIGK